MVKRKLNVDINKDKFTRTDLTQIYKYVKDENINIKWLDLFRKSTRGEALDKIKNKIEKTKKQYRVNFIIYTKAIEGKKYKRKINLKGILYAQVGKAYQIITDDTFFIKNFNTKGNKNNIVDSRDNRFEQTKSLITKKVKDMNALHLLSYMDAIYISGIGENKKTKANNIKKEKKFNEDVISSVFNKYLYYDIKDNDIYGNHPYLKDNYKSKSCMLTVIIDTYYEQFQKRKSDGKRIYKDDITYEYLCNLFNFECDDNNIGCSIEEALPFFIKFNLGLKVFDMFNNVIYDHTPKTYNKSISPSTLYLLTYNSHVFKLKDDIKTLQQIYKNNDKKILEVSNTYNILNTIENNNYFVCDSLDDILITVEDVIKDSEDNKQTIYIQYSKCMNKLCYDLVYKKNYVPSINVDGVIVDNIKLNLKINNIKCNVIITSVDKAELIDNNDIAFDELSREALPEYTKEYNETYFKYYNWLVNKKHLSKYNNDYKEFEDNNIFSPLCCVIKNTKKNLIALDINKSYTSNLIDMEYFPSFNVFDIYKKYDNHKIEDYTLYYIKCKNNNVGSRILFSSRYSMAYGYKLNRIDSDLFDILYYKRPSNLYKSNSKNKVKELYNNNILSNSSKKNIINILLGLLEKKKNKKCKTQLFLNEQEAQYYIDEFGGVKGELDFLEESENGIFVNGNTEDKKVFYVKNEIQRDLINGFLPIKNMIYDIQRLKLYDLYIKCISNNINVYGIKTDCVLLDSNDLLKVEKIFELSSEVGGLKIEKDKILFGDLLEMNENEFIKPYQYINNNIKINDEYDKNELGEINNKYNNIVYLAENAGCGKSTASMCGYDKDKILFVSPFNKQCIELKKDGYDSITINKFFGKGVGEFNISNGYDWSEKQLIIFDEILLNNINFLYSIYDFVNDNKDKIKIICNGDVNQLKAINFGVNNILDESEYRLNCIQIIFNNYVKLTNIKRLYKESDKIKMNNIKKDIFNGVDIKDICKRYNIKTIDNYNNVNTLNNISFFNFRSNMINKLIHKKVSRTIKEDKIKIDNIDIWKGLIISCKKHFKTKYNKTYVNNLYVIKSIDKYINVVDLNDESNIFNIDKNKLWSIFSLNYCNTCHSEQGCSIDNDITIFDANTPYVNKYWLYTAITRARDLDRVYIYIHNNNEVRQLEMSKFKQYINNKIDGYKEQDKISNRSIKKNYVDWEWFINEYNKKGCCYHCQKSFDLELRDDTIYSDITLDRVNDDYGHTKDNLILSCLNCNCKKIKY